MKVPLATAITPLLLTYNEAPNIGRTLKTLQWAARVVVLDSGSSDETEAIARSFPNVAWRTRSFDSFKGQTDFGLHHTGIESEFILALDADMSLGVGVVEEIAQHFLPGNYDGGLFTFQYCIAGQPLAGSLYPAQIRLFRPGLIDVQQVGHGHKFHLSGAVYPFKAPLLHDDRKSLEHWAGAQLAYSSHELQRLQREPPLGWRDQLRRLGVMPWLVGTFAYCKAGGPFGGAAAVRYAYERAVFEGLLAIRLMTDKIEKESSPATDSLPAKTVPLSEGEKH